MNKASAEDVAARKRARAIYIESKGQAGYDDIALQLKLEGLGDVKGGTLRQWRTRDIKAGYIKPDELAREFERIGKQAEKVAQTLNLPTNLTLAEKIDCARIADLEDTHERMLRVTNACAERLIREIPNIPINEIGDATTLSCIAERISESSIKLRLALVQVQELKTKIINAQDENGKSLHAEIIPPARPTGLNQAIDAFSRVGVG